MRIIFIFYLLWRPFESWTSTSAANYRP